MSAERIVKNIGSGLIAQVWTVLLGLVALPILVRGLGAERYGLLALSLALIGFAAVADLGVGRAASKYLAEDFEKNETLRTQHYINTALTVSLAAGIVGTLLLASAVPFLVHRVFTIPTNMEQEARLVLWTTAAGLVPVLLRILFDGVLAGHHRIAFLSFGNIVANSLKAGLSIAVVFFGGSLVGVVLVNVIVSYLHAAGLWWYTRHYFSGRVTIRLAWESAAARQLLALGIGSTLSWILGSVVFLYADRFLIATFLSVALLGYYAVAFDISSKQWYVSNSVAQAFFPVFSGSAATNSEALQRNYLHATKAIAVGATGIAAMLIVHSRPLLTYWINDEFGSNASHLLVILTIGMVISCYTSVPYTAIIAGAARPDICVKIFLAAIALHVGGSLALMRIAGSLGIALAFTFAYAFVLVCLLAWVRRNLIRIGLLPLIRHCYLGPWGSALVVGLFWWFFVKPVVHNLWSAVVSFALGYFLYLGICWLVAYTSQERAFAWQMGRKFLGLAEDKPYVNFSSP